MNLFGGAEEVIMNLFKEVKTMQVLGQFGQPGVLARFLAEEVHFHFSSVFLFQQMINMTIYDFGTLFLQERRFAAEHAMEAAVAMARSVF